MYDVFLFRLPFDVRLKIRPLFEALEAHGSNSTAFYLLLVTVAMTTASQSQQGTVFAARQAMRILKTIRIHAAVKRSLVCFVFAGLICSGVLLLKGWCV